MMVSLLSEKEVQFLGIQSGVVEGGSNVAHCANLEKVIKFKGK